MYRTALPLLTLLVYAALNFTQAVTRQRNLFITPVRNKVDTYKTYYGSPISVKRGATWRKTTEPIPRRNVNVLYDRVKDSHAVKERESDTIEMNGVVDQCLANTNFVVRIPNGETFLCFISGKLRINKVKINLGDMVKIQIHKLNFEKRRGKIVFRYLQHAALGGKKC
ncbi:translation initiation factor 1A [Plasmodium inui San Antonio 1]|uniref:Translation initiation factor 1A n=1 Tax=Plasmodium inui San Antonio 1 TaxID=1237626 RepID=W7AK73_9APIC|nr:translation initiation factor 1A [Plasmodium inui San Antonio 1]EUD69229.1 translation initiation factor 1A [Plasmodium inui San Antonio 1]